MSESNPDVLKAVRLLVGDLVNKERYVMLPAEPGEGDPAPARGELREARQLLFGAEVMGVLQTGRETS